MRKFLSVAALMLCVSTSAFGQNTIIQGGPVVPNHAPMYAPGSGQQPVVMDSGPASGQGVQSGLSELLLVAQGQGNPPFANTGTGPNAENECNYDGPVSSVGGYHYLCFSPNAQGGGLISYGAANGAPQLPLQFLINGTLSAPGIGTVTSVGLASPLNTLALGGTNPITTGGTINADINTTHANTWTATQTFPASSITNTELANPATTVNGQTCTLGASCTVSAAASQIVVGGTAILGGTNGNVEFNIGGVLGEKAVTGTGSVVLNTSPVINGTVSGTAIGTTGATIPLNNGGFTQSGVANFTGGGSASTLTATASGSTTPRSLAARAGEVANVLDYGAKCDGSTDDTAAISAALTAANGKMPVVIPAAICNVSSAIIPPQSSMIIGENWNTSALNVTSTTADVFDINNSFVTISNLQITTFVTRTAGSYVNVASGGSNFVMNQYSMSGAWNAVTIRDGASGVSFTNGNHFGSRSSNFQVGTGTASGPTAVYLSNIVMNTLHAPTHIIISNLGDMIMNDVQALGGAVNLLVNPGNGQVVASLKVQNSFFDFATNDNFQAAPTGTGLFARSNFDGVWFGDTATNQIDLNGGSASGGIDGITFVDCEVYAASGFGFGVSGDTKNVSWIGGKIAQNGTGILDNRTTGWNGFSIIGAMIGNVGGWGANTLGVNLEGAGDYATVTGNTIKGNTTNLTNTNSGSHNILQFNNAVSPVLAASSALCTDPSIGISTGCSGTVTNADLVNAATTVNGQTCTLGSPCTVTAAASGVTVGTTTISGGAGNILSDTAGVLSETATSGTGNLTRVTSPVFVTPTLGVATGTSLALNGCTITGIDFCTAGAAKVGGAMNFADGSSIDSSGFEMPGTTQTFNGTGAANITWLFKNNQAFADNNTSDFDYRFNTSTSNRVLVRQAFIESTSADATRTGEWQIQTAQNGSGTTTILDAKGSQFSVTGTESISTLAASSPVVSTDSSKNLTTTAPTQTANTVYAGPTSGGVASPTFRALVGADLPNPSASTLGGIQSIAAVSHNFLASVSTSGVPSQAQPAFTDISGTVATGQLPSGVNPVLSGTTASLGGSALLAGQCSTNTTTVTGATTSMVALADPQTDPGTGAYWDAFVSSSNTVTTKVCATVALTPNASVYNLRVIQ